MSLIIARKEGSQLSIVSDTKITFPYHETKAQKANPTEGVLKTIVVNPNLSISYAGEIDHAENAVKAVRDNNDFINVSKILFEHHQLSNFKTEFLLCSGEPKPVILEIKNNYSREVDASWIGDIQAFNRFQEAFLGEKKAATEDEKNISTNSKANILITEMNLSFETNVQVNSFSKMSSAMDDVIEDGNINSVGGFKVNVVYEGRFEYTKYGKLYRGNVELFGSGAHAIGHGSANEGAYSINFFGATNDYQTVGLHVQQGRFGIIYKREEFGLLRPKVFRLDEVDFTDFVRQEFDLNAAFITQDRMQKFITDAFASFHKKKFDEAKQLFDKALKEKPTEKQKAEILYYKGITLLNLGETILATQTFQQAINLDNSYHHKILKLFMMQR